MPCQLKDVQTECADQLLSTEMWFYLVLLPPLQFRTILTLRKARDRGWILLFLTRLKVLFKACKKKSSVVTSLSQALAMRKTILSLIRVRSFRVQPTLLEVKNE